MTKRGRRQHHRSSTSGSRRRFNALIDLLDGPALASVAEHLEREVDAFGWDQPWRLWGLVPGPHRDSFDEFEARMMHLGAVDVSAEDRRAAKTLMTKSIALLPVVAAGDGHPVEFLRGVKAPSAVAGVVLSTEGWVLPDDDIDSGIAPADHPRRGEVRIVTVQLRNGKSASVEHRRGGRISSHTEAWAGRLPDTLARVLSLTVPARVSKLTALGRLTTLAYLKAARSTIPAGWVLPPAATAATWQFALTRAEATRWADVCTTDPLHSLIADIGDRALADRLVHDNAKNGDWADPVVVAAVTAAFGPDVIFKSALRGGLGFDTDLTRWLGAGGCFDEFASVMPSAGRTLERLTQHSPGAAQLLRWLLEARGWTEQPWSLGESAL